MPSLSAPRSRHDPNIRQRSAEIQGGRCANITLAVALAPRDWLLGRCLTLAKYATGDRPPTHEATAVGGSSICLRSLCQAGAKGKRCTAYHPDMGIMRKR